MALWAIHKAKISSGASYVLTMQVDGWGQIFFCRTAWSRKNVHSGMCVCSLPIFFFPVGSHYLKVP